MGTGRVVIPIAWLLVGLFATASSAQFAASRGAQPTRFAETWFEGWYTRITADNGADAVGLIVGAYYRLRENRGSESTQAYVAILRRNADTGLLEVHEHFPDCARVRSARTQSRLLWCNPESPVFEWQADGIGFANEKEIAIRLPDGSSLTASLHGRQPWQPAFPWRGPEGLAEQLRLLRCHWSVFSVASRAKFTLTTPTHSVSGMGYAHQETNWGESFPKAYVWAQGCSPDGRNGFALAGGVLPVGHGFREGWLLGLRTSAAHWDFRTQIPGTSFTTRIDASRGQFTMTAHSTLRRVEVEVSAAPSTFHSLAVPTRDGFAHGTIQSFSASAHIRAYRCGPTRSSTLVESLQIANAALEFGGDYRPAALESACTGVTRPISVGRTTEALTTPRITEKSVN